MSLINQMLKDIDKRQAASGKNFSDSPELRSGVRRQATSPVKLGLLWGGLFLVAAAAGVYGFQHFSRPAAPVLTQAMPVPPPVEPVSSQVSVAAAPAAVAAPAVAAAPTVVAPNATVSSVAAAREVANVSKPEPVREVVKPKAEVTQAAAVVPSPVAAAAAEAAVKPPLRAPAAVSGTVTRQLSVEQRADNAYREAVTLVRQGRGAEAQKLLQQILMDLPANHDARTLSARVLMDQGKLLEAKALLADGVALNPQAFQFYAALAQAQLMGKEVNSAVATLERGLPIAEENAEYQALLAAALQQQGRHAEAVRHYVVALRQLPDTSNWLVGLGVSLQALNNTVGAAEAYQRALDLGLPASLSQFTRDKLNQLKR